MRLTRIEALTDGLIRLGEYDNPEKASYRYRNPLGLRIFCVHGRGFGNCDTCPPQRPLLSRAWRGREWDKVSGMRMFKTHLDGYQAAVFDVTLKCSGKSHANLPPDAGLIDLCISYAMPGARPAQALAKFLRRALDCDVTENTELSFFLEADNG